MGLLTLFRTKQIMGISLKKIGNGPAQWKEVNVSGKFFKTLKSTKMNLESAKCLLGTKRIDPAKAKKDIERGKPRGAPGASTLLQDTVLTINDPGIVSGNPTKYTVQIKANDSTKFSNFLMNFKCQSSQLRARHQVFQKGSSTEYL